MGPILYQKRSIQELVDNGEADGVWHTSMPIDSKMDLASVLKDKVKAFMRHCQRATTVTKGERFWPKCKS